MRDLKTKPVQIVQAVQSPRGIAALIPRGFVRVVSGKAAVQQFNGSMFTGVIL
jgi:hypothetical protein